MGVSMLGAVIACSGLSLYLLSLRPLSQGVISLFHVSAIVTICLDEETANVSEVKSQNSIFLPFEFVFVT